MLKYWQSRSAKFILSGLGRECIGAVRIEEDGDPAVRFAASWSTTDENLDMLEKALAGITE